MFLPIPVVDISPFLHLSISCLSDGMRRTVLTVERLDHAPAESTNARKP